MKGNNFNRKLLNLCHPLLVKGWLFFILLSLILFNIGCETLDIAVNPENEELIDNSEDMEETASGEEADESKTEETPADSKEDTAKEEDSGTEETLPEEGTGNQEEEKPDDEPGGNLNINVYYADMEVRYLVGESRSVHSDNKYAEVINELMKLPVDSSLIRLIPATTVVNSVTVEEGIAKVDLSDNFVQDRATSDTEDVLLVYSIVNTLTGFSDVNAVNFYINGDKLDELGMLDLSNPCYRRNDLIKS